jgi:hypothetical protein
MDRKGKVVRDRGGRTITYGAEGEIDWKVSDRAFPEHALRWLLRRRYCEEEIVQIRLEAKAWKSARSRSSKKKPRPPSPGRMDIHEGSVTGVLGTHARRR